jgi:putative Mg2+ transporter-C (MgtC) family protein
MTSITFFSHILLAVVLGGAIGLERQWRQRLAGLRTNALVALGSAAFVALSAMAAEGEAGADRTRIAAQVVSGIGFLGGGIILKEGLNVRGLNTAATLWCSAAVGALAGLGYLLPAVLSAALVVLTNVGLRPLAQYIDRQPVAPQSEVETCYLIEVTCRDRVVAHIRDSLLQEAAADGLLLRSLQREALENSNQVTLTAEIVTAGRNDRLIERITSRLSLEQGTSAIRWKQHPHEA